MSEKIDLERLIERHPLPWEYVGFAEPDGVVLRYHDPAGKLIEDPLAYDLADAAPAMALAILAFLQSFDEGRPLSMHADALRAALPEALRP